MIRLFAELFGHYPAFPPSGARCPGYTEPRSARHRAARRPIPDDTEPLARPAVWCRPGFDVAGASCPGRAARNTIRLCFPPDFHPLRRQHDVPAVRGKMPRSCGAQPLPSLLPSRLSSAPPRSAVPNQPRYAPGEDGKLARDIGGRDCDPGKYSRANLRNRCVETRRPMPSRSQPIFFEW